MSQASDQFTLREDIADITGFLSSIPDALDSQEQLTLDSLQEIVEDLDGTIKDLKQMLREFKKLVKKAKPKAKKSSSPGSASAPP